MSEVKSVKLSDLIAKPFYKIHSRVKHKDATHFWLKGGRGSTKSSFVAIEIILSIMREEEANAVVIRRVKDTLKESVFEQLIWAINALGVDKYWHINKSPLGLKYKPTGQRIIFRGCDDPQKLKSTKVSKGYIKYVWYEEVDELAGPNQIRTINQSLLRGGSEFIVFYTYNPPKSTTNWVNVWTEQEKHREDTIVHHSTYLGVPKKWLGEVFIAEAEHLKKTRPDLYEHEFIGKVTGTGGEIFKNVQTVNLTEEDIDAMYNVYYGLDFGYATDPLAYIGVEYNQKKRSITIFEEYRGVGISNAKLAEHILKTGNTNLIEADSAEPKTIDELRQYGVRVKGVKKVKGSVEHGIKWLSEHIETIYIDPDRCPETYKEFTEYELEKTKDGVFKNKYPDKNNHSIDAVRYALANVIGKHKRPSTKLAVDPNKTYTPTELEDLKTQHYKIVKEKNTLHRAVRRR